jgi:hypothetical protein
MNDLGRSLGTAMTLGRLAAKKDGHDDLAQLLEVSKVIPDEGSFQIDVALPLDLVERTVCAGIDGGSPRP